MCHNCPFRSILTDFLEAKYDKDGHLAPVPMPY